MWLSHLLVFILAFILFHLTTLWTNRASPSSSLFSPSATFSAVKFSQPLASDQLINTLGEHIIVEITSAPSHLLNDLTGLLQATRGILLDANLTAVDIKGHQFAPQGISAVAILSESHLSVHTWPELGYAAVDVYTCGLEVAGRAAKAATGIVQYLQAEEYHMSIVKRGIPSPKYLTKSVK